MKRILIPAILMITLATPALAVDQETLDEFTARTNVEERSGSLSAVIAATRACGFGPILPTKDIATIRAAYVQMDRDAYLKGSPEGLLAVRRRRYKPGSNKCRKVLPVIQRGLRGIKGLAKTLREFGFE